jgi:hypothetical protein
MLRPWIHALLLISPAFPLFSACSSDVEVATTSTTGAGGSASSSSGGGDCTGNGPFCAWGCGSDAFDQPLCQNGVWVCPEGTVDASTCPSGTCWGPPLPCEVCDNGFKCAPTEACVGSCSSFVCATCDGAPAGTTFVGACSCSCDSAGQYGCSLLPGCCTQDIDCGDKTLFPCVNHVCKQPVPGACWADIECGSGMKCDGAIVCSCMAACEVPDSPGKCVPI